ncbi:hypothetical protein AGDE_11742 [Angomonas deanei]|nr:hypothetical protein AGDE_11742 [Angomonas deanei]|eukprot:EPY25465.1 hypothetical protein AGDE_11742 [Angomonas deanei]
MFRFYLNSEEKSNLSSICAAKREYVREHLDHLNKSTSPAALWNALVKYCTPHAAKPPAEGDSTTSAMDTYEELEIDFSRFRQMAYELIFNVTPDELEALRVEEKEKLQSFFFSHPFLSPATFLAFARSSSGTVPAVHLYAFAAKRMLLFRLRVNLELCATAPPPLLRERDKSGERELCCPPSISSPLSNGLTQTDVERFIKSLIPNMRFVRDVPPWMLPYYLCHASRKVFLCVTPVTWAPSQLSLSCRSEVFSELLRMFETDPKDAVVGFPVGCPVEVSAALTHASADADDTVPAVVISFDGEGSDLHDLYKVKLVQGGETLSLRRSGIFWNSGSADYFGEDCLNMDNWFSLPLMCRIYEHFTFLDLDGDGVLTVEELYNYSSASFTKLAIDRVFECHVPHSGKRHIMDYKTYLNFVIATEHAATLPAIKYIWKVLDIADTKDHIDVTALYAFCKELSNELNTNGLMSGLSANCILSEIVDMINPEWHECITFDDLMRSGQQATVLPILLSSKNFFTYDCREQSAATAKDEFTEF